MIKFSASFENISSNGGFSFVSGILDSIFGMSLWDRLLAVHCNTRFSHQAIVRSAIGLMTAGCCDFADIEKFWLFDKNNGWTNITAHRKWLLYRAYSSP